MLPEHNYLENKEVTDSSPKPLQTSLQKDSENGLNQGSFYPQELQEIIDRWDNLPEHIKAAIMALIQTHSTEAQ